MSENRVTVYELIGGEETFERLVQSFYAKVEADEELRAIFPEDLEPGKVHQKFFLMQYWGGPAIYSEERGHPRLRMRHNPFAITPHLRNRWVEHMLAAIDDVGIEEPSRSLMREYFERAASVMVNRYQPPSE
ncbi:MAG: globin [Anaerolineae bacterium]|nr:globin [Anaerolineae bacterium]MDQ7035183.1 globin [Anaerolineae bacterium]